MGSICLGLLDIWEPLEVSGIGVIDHEIPKTSKMYIAMNNIQDLLLR